MSIASGMATDLRPLAVATRLIAKATCLAALVAASVGGFEAGLAGVPNTYTEKKRLIEAAAPHIEALVLGPSHAYFGLDTRELAPWTFNMANVSQDLLYDRLLLEHYLDRLPHLGLVILPVSRYELHVDLAESAEGWRTFFYERAYGFASPLGPWHMEHVSYAALYGNKEAPFLLAHHLLGQPVAPAFDDHGRVLSRPGIPPVVSDDSGRARAAYHSRYVRPALVEGQLAQVGRLASALAERHIRLLLVTLPVYETYRRNVEGRVARETPTRLRALARARGVPYLDYYADPRFKRADFWDNDHLNPDGARKFTRLLAADADRLGTGPALTPRR